MKRTLRRIRIGAALLAAAGLILCWAGCGRQTPAGETKPVRYVVGLSPFLDDSVKDEVFRHLARLLLEDMPLNSSLWIYDAYLVRTVTQIDIPDVRAFRTAKTRANQFKKPLQELKEFLAAEPMRPESRAVNFDQAVRLPQFLEFVAENLTGPRHSVIVVVLGSPLYVDAKELSFSMVDGYFPSDGHLTASREESVFGIGKRSEALRGISLHFGYFGNPWVSEIHREKIDRFWTLYLKGQGGRLGTFCGDVPTVFNAVRGEPGGSEARNQWHELDGAETKIEMLRITREVGVADWITRDSSSIPRHGPPATTFGPMKIGIRWQGALDLDLYARPNEQGEMLFFQQTRSPSGYYFRDHRSSPEREYEFIEFLAPVDVWQADAYVNFYEGAAAGGPSGEVRIEFEGKIYLGRFHLAAERGNRGRAGGGQGDYWATIDIPGILKLR